MLVEEIRPDGMAIGTTGRYVQAEAPAEQAEQGELIDLVGDQSNGEIMLAIR